MHYVDRLTTFTDFIYSLFFRIFAAAEAPIDWEPVDVSPVKQVNFESSFVFFSRGQNFGLLQFLPARSARSSEAVLLFLLFLARRLVGIEKLCFLVHGKFIICFVRLP